MHRSLLVIVLVAACSDTPADPDASTLRFMDQSGAEFWWDCNDEGENCEIHRIAGVSPPLPECPEGQVPRLGYLKNWRFFTAYAGCYYDPGTVWFGFDRIAVCEEDSDCPQIPEKGYAYECRHGFCQDTNIERHPPGVLNMTDTYALCFGSAPRTTDGSVIGWYEFPREEREKVIEACNADFVAPCDYLPDDCADPG
jgi:hypothetical protein